MLKENEKVDPKTLIKEVAMMGSDLREKLEDAEQFILGTSETVNEKLEEIQSQMRDLLIEINSNIDIVRQKRKTKAKDSN